MSVGLIVQPDCGRVNKVVYAAMLFQIIRIFHEGVYREALYVTEILAMLARCRGVFGFGKHGAVAAAYL
jgi:hypothetical protein